MPKNPDCTPLIVDAVGFTVDGKMKRTVRKHVQATATMLIGVDHFPSENGPGWNVFRPVVSRRTIGVA